MAAGSVCPIPPASNAASRSCRSRRKSPCTAMSSMRSPSSFRSSMTTPLRALVARVVTEGFRFGKDHSSRLYFVSHSSWASWSSSTVSAPAVSTTGRLVFHFLHQPLHGEGDGDSVPRGFRKIQHPIAHTGKAFVRELEHGGAERRFHRLDIRSDQEGPAVHDGIAHLDLGRAVDLPAAYLHIVDRRGLGRHPETPAPRHDHLSHDPIQFIRLLDSQQIEGGMLREEGGIAETPSVLVHGAARIGSAHDGNALLPAVADIRILPGVLEDAHEDAGHHLSQPEGGLAPSLRDSPQEGLFHGEVEEGVCDPVLQESPVHGRFSQSKDTSSSCSP